MTVQAAGHSACRAASEKRIQHNVAALGRSQEHPRQKGFRLLRRMRLATVGFQTLGPGADRKLPVGSHLHIVVQRLHRLIIECVARILRARRPDQRFMGIGKAAATEIRHRVGLAPHHIIQHPEIEILNDPAEPVDIVVAADHPERAIRLQDAARLGKPGRRESVIRGEAVELVPVILDAGDGRMVGT